MSIAALKWAFSAKVEGTAKAVLLALANRADDTGRCWPGMAELMRHSGWKERAVQLALRQLEVEGWITVERRQGRASVYQLTMDRAECPVDNSVDKSETPAPHAGVGGALDAGVNGQGGALDAGGGACGAPEPSLNLQVVSKNNNTTRARRGDDAGFVDFWAAYPRKVGKGAALKAWRKATARCAPEQIMAGLARARWADDPQFIPHPATWLNQDRWADEHIPVSGQNNVGRSDWTPEQWLSWATTGQRPASLVRQLLAHQPAALAMYEARQRGTMH